MKIEEDSSMKRKRQGYNERLDESLGERHGSENVFRQSLKDRRDESKGEAKRRSGDAYSGDADMEDYDKERLHHHMMSASHKFMAQHHRRQMHKRK